MITSKAISQSPQTIDAQLKEVLAQFPKIILALLFGSVALGRQRADSDLDIAVAAKDALTAHEKIALICALADCTGRPIVLIDLKVVSDEKHCAPVGTISTVDPSSLTELPQSLQFIINMYFLQIINV